MGAGRRHFWISYVEDVELFKAKHTERGYLMARDIWLQDVKNDRVDPNDACQMRRRAEFM